MAVKEMKTLTINGEIFEIVDDKSRKDIKEIKAFQMSNIGGGTVKTVNGIEPDENGNIVIDELQSIEPAEDDIPKVFFTGTAPTTKAEDELPLLMEYHSKTKNFKSYVTLKVQGDSSAKYAKKNFNIKMFKDSDRSEKLKLTFRDWSKTHKYCLKANWIDATQARNVVNGRLWGQVVRSRADYENYPKDYKESANCGTVNGFPIKVYLNGIYQGRYTWNIRKDESMFNMDDSLGTQAALIADGVSTITAWRALPVIGSGDWTDELNDTVPPAIKTSFQNAYSFVMNSTDEQFVANIEQYFYLSSLIDYYIFIYVILMFGGLAKSQTMLTYDGVKYLANIYDMDTTWALTWDGGGFYDVLTPCPDRYEHSAGTNLLYERLVALFPDKIQERYTELRDGALSDANIINEFEKFICIMPPELIAEDYAETTANGAFTEIPSKDTNTLIKLREIITTRTAYCDEQIGFAAISYSITNNLSRVTNDNVATTIERNGMYVANLTIDGEVTELSIIMRGKDVTNEVYDDGVIEIFDVTGDIVITVRAVDNLVPAIIISLSTYELTFTEMTPQTIEAAVLPIDTTDILTWSSSDEDIATVEDGVVTPISNGSCVIMAKAGSISVGCQVTIRESALYPLNDDTWSNSTGTLSAEVTNGSHVKITNTGTKALKGIFINITDVSSGSPVNHASEFTLFAGDVVKYAVKGSDGAINVAQSFGWRKANTNTAITELAVMNKTDNFVNEVTLSADYDVGAMFIYGTFPAGTTYEYDISLRVNGVKYI